ncbi:MAG: alanine racemase [Candidatus Nanopelagicaceae bacterium]
MREIQIDLAALKANVQYLKTKAERPILAVVKADAYGHGLIPCAKAAIEAGADWLGTALLEEALTLREAGVTAPILAWLLPPGENYRRAVEQNIDLGVSSLAAFDEINAIAGARIHLEIETGMGRGGFADEWPELLTRDLSQVVGIFTHLARADEPEQPQNQSQIAKFNQMVGQLNELGITPIRHLANTAATLSNSEAKFDLVRIGIAMYGLSPLGSDNNLKPVMKVRAKLVLVKELPAGHPIGYGATESTTENTKIGIVAMGYADGIPRNAKGAGVTFQSQSAPIIGRVSMDQFAVDLGPGSEAKSGDWVTVVGDNYDAYAWAKACQTIHYEITTRMGSRITRVNK